MQSRRNRFTNMSFVLIVLSVSYKWKSIYATLCTLAQIHTRMSNGNIYSYSCEDARPHPSVRPSVHHPIPSTLPLSLQLLFSFTHSPRPCIPLLSHTIHSLLPLLFLALSPSPTSLHLSIILFILSFPSLPPSLPPSTHPSFSLPSKLLPSVPP